MREESGRNPSWPGAHTPSKAEYIGADLNCQSQFFACNSAADHTFPKCRFSSYTRLRVTVVSSVRRYLKPLFAAAVLPYVGIQCWVILQQPTWHALSAPIKRSGTIRSPLFVTKATTGYRIMIEFDRKIDFDRLECLLGLAFVDALKKCADIPEVLSNK
jgi:hypothetical protein